jgi:regulation of enolase protein 1 (concanavalin A-like superfamily)
MNKRKWLPLALLALAVAGLDAGVFRATPFRIHHERPTEELEGPTNADGAVRQRLMMMRDWNGQIPRGALMRAKAHADRARARWRARHGGAGAAGDPLQMASGTVGGTASRAPGFRWLGPTTTAGRVRTIAIHPTNPNVLIVGSAGGGIWRSTDGGASWMVSDDFMPVLSVSSIVFDPRDSNVLYAGTGEGYFNQDAIGGAGIFKSTDGGASWAQLPATAPAATPNFDDTNRLAFSLDGAVLLAATNHGVFRSTDGGLSFAATTVSGWMGQVVFSPNDSNDALAAGFGAVYVTHDSGQSWTAASGLQGGRIEVGYSKSDGSIYASVDDNGGSLYRSFDSGASFSKIASDATRLLGGQGWYNNTIWVNPFDANNIIVGGVQVWESRDGGATVAFIDHGPLHADTHIIVADPRFDGVTNRTIYVGTDGGVFRTTEIWVSNNNVQWEALNNGLGVTQFYAAAGSNGTVIGGSQDNSTQRYSSGSWAQAWTLGDGGFVAADQADGRLFYADGQYGVPFGSSDGGVTFSAIGSGITDGTQTNFIAPLIIDPNASQRLYLGKSRLWRADDANGNTLAHFRAVTPVVGSNVSAIAVQPGNSDVVWVAWSSGRLDRTTNGTSATPSWTPVRQFFRYVTRVRIDPNDPNSVFVTLGGFQADNVWHTADGGVTWTPVAGSGETALPLAPVYDIAIDPVTPGCLYAATEVGEFKSTDNGATWDVPDGLGPANTRVMETFWMDGTLMLATYGRGIWALDVNASSGPAFTASPSSVTFASQAVGTTSPSQAVAIRNTGTAPMNVQSVSIGGGSSFGLTSDACTGATVAAGASCTVQVAFTPVASGSQSGTLSIADSAPGSPHRVPLSGTGTVAQPSLPSPWVAQDIGAVGVSGTASGSNGTFTVSGAGADVWNTQDALQFVYQPLSGDGAIVARVATVQPVASWTKTGVMIRQALTPDAAHAFMIVSAGKGLAFQRRTVEGGISTSTSGIAGAAPTWVRIARAGTTVTASYSLDGNTWTIVGQDTIQLSATAYVGMAVSSHDNTQRATATFDQVSITAAETLRPGWQTADIGGVGAAGSAHAAGETFTVAGAGADVWNTADAFRYAYYPLAGDGTIVARVASVEDVAPWTKAGVMLRQSLSPDSAHAFMLVSAGKGLAFQRRTTQGGVSTSTSGGGGVAPFWMKLVRAGQSVSAYASADGASWTLVGQDTIAFTGQIWAGLGVSSHDTTRAATATFDAVSITAAATLPPGWQQADIGNVGPAGSASATGGTFTVKGAGADVWGTEDALHYAYTTLAGDGEIVARVATVENVAAWTKAGVMIRGSLDPSSPQAFMLVSAGKGAAFQRRTAPAGISTSTSGGSATAPAWVRLVRSGTTISAFWSMDGASWTLVAEDAFSMSGSVYVGVAVSSHDATRLAAATFDGVVVR